MHAARILAYTPLSEAEQKQYLEDTLAFDALVAKKVKSQLDSGIFRPLQLAAVEALSQGPEWFAALNGEYRRRQLAAGRIFDLLGVRYNPASQGLFLWGRVPDGVDPVALSDKLLYEAGVFITPGFIFGRNGKKYLRISLCAKEEVLSRAYEKIKAVL